MPSFDIVSRLNFAELDNAINNTHKAVMQRFDFRGTTAEIALDKKEKTLKLVADDDGKLKGLREMLNSAINKRGIDIRSFEWGDLEATVAGKTKCEAKIKDGIEQETAKTIVKAIKASGLKVQASIQEDELRVSGKKLDDLQAVMKMCREGDWGLPLQFVNLKS
jgi:cyclic-di-GMP-binding protein